MWESRDGNGFVRLTVASESLRPGVVNHFATLSSALHGGFFTDDFACKAHGNAVTTERVHSARCRRADILSAEPVPLNNGGGQHVPKPTADNMSALRSVQKSAVSALGA
jgi:hypothetical protein